MSYTALYRKYRPSDFNDVDGQDHIVTTLKNQIKADRLGHAYLFHGTRGTGKTTVAKVLGKVVNCLQPVDGNPCNHCEMCNTINAGVSMNLIEIDAASNNGVDNIREIVEEVRYSPTEGKYKVYIIDEVHMLSQGAFNALLKTLEEPPSYVIFILATTEAHKIPITILSRCQRYDFKRISIDVISQRLKKLMDIEEVSVEEKALRYIARMGDGSFRDSLSLLDQCIAFYYGETLTYDMVLEVLGAVDTEVFKELLDCILDENVNEVMKKVEDLVLTGKELTQFTTDFTWYLRNLLLVKTSNEAMDVAMVSTENYNLMKQQSEIIDGERIIRYIRIFSELSNQIKYASQKRVMVEVALIKLCKPQMEQGYEDILSRLQQIEKQLERGLVMTRGSSSSNSKYTSDSESMEHQAEQREQVVLEKALSEDLKVLANNWSRILNSISPLVKAVLVNAKPSIGPNNSLLLVFKEEIDKIFMTKEEHMASLKTGIANVIHKDVDVHLQYVNPGTQIASDIPDLTKIIKKIPIEYED